MKGNKEDKIISVMDNDPEAKWAKDVKELFKEEFIRQGHEKYASFISAYSEHVFYSLADTQKRKFFRHTIIVAVNIRTIQIRSTECMKHFMCNSCRTWITSLGCRVILSAIAI